MKTFSLHVNIAQWRKLVIVAVSFSPSLSSLSLNPSVYTNELRLNQSSSARMQFIGSHWILLLSYYWTICSGEETLFISMAVFESVLFCFFMKSSVWPLGFHWFLFEFSWFLEQWTSLVKYSSFSSSVSSSVWRNRVFYKFPFRSLSCKKKIADFWKQKQKINKNK